MTVLTLTSRGQLTLNKALQKHLGVCPGDQIEVAVMPNGSSKSLLSVRER